MKSKLLCLLIVYCLFYDASGQNKGPFYTTYSKLNNNQPGAEEYTIGIKNNIFYKTDSYGSKYTYPVKVVETGYIEDFYCEIYALDKDGLLAKDDLETAEYYIYNDLRSFYFFYNSKNGSLHKVIEKKFKNSRVYSTKTYGYKNSFQFTNNKNDLDFNIYYEFANASSMQSFYNKFVKAHRNIETIFMEGDNNAKSKSKIAYPLKNITNSDDFLIFHFSDKEEITAIVWHASTNTQSKLISELDLARDYFERDGDLYWFDETSDFSYMQMIHNSKVKFYMMKI